MVIESTFMCTKSHPLGNISSHKDAKKLHKFPSKAYVCHISVAVDHVLWITRNTCGPPPDGQAQLRMSENNNMMQQMHIDVACHTVSPSHIKIQNLNLLYKTKYMYLKLDDQIWFKFYHVHQIIKSTIKLLSTWEINLGYKDWLKLDISFRTNTDTQTGLCSHDSVIFSFFNHYPSSDLRWTNVIHTFKSSLLYGWYANY